MRGKTTRIERNRMLFVTVVFDCPSTLVLRLRRNTPFIMYMYFVALWTFLILLPTWVRHSRENLTCTLEVGSSQHFDGPNIFDTMSVCAKCTKPLEVEVDYSDDEDVEMGGSSSAAQQSSHTVPDDVRLPCGDHFHWVSHCASL